MDSRHHAEYKPEDIISESGSQGLIGSIEEK